MKKKLLKSLLVTLAVVGIFSVGVFAGNNMQAITAYLNYGITVEYNDVDQIMYDANGNRVYPITYNGSTYLPVRAVANMLGTAVNWDAGTNHVLLGNSYVDYVAPSTPTPAPQTTPSQYFDLNFIGNAIASAGSDITLSESSRKHLDANGIWQGTQWDTGVYTFPGLDFISTKGPGYSTPSIARAEEAAGNALIANGYTLAKVDNFGQKHYVNGAIEVYVWNISGSNSDLQISLKTGYQSCCALGSN